MGACFANKKKRKKVVAKKVATQHIKPQNEFLQDWPPSWLPILSSPSLLAQSNGDQSDGITSPSELILNRNSASDSAPIILLDENDKKSEQNVMEEEKRITSEILPTKTTSMNSAISAQSTPSSPASASNALNKYEITMKKIISIVDKYSDIASISSKTDLNSNTTTTTATTTNGNGKFGRSPNSDISLSNTVRSMISKSAITNSVSSNRKSNSQCYSGLSPIIGAIHPLNIRSHQQQQPPKHHRKHESGKNNNNIIKKLNNKININNNINIIINKSSERLRSSVIGLQQQQQQQQQQQPKSKTVASTATFANIVNSSGRGSVGSALNQITNTITESQQQQAKMFQKQKSQQQRSKMKSSKNIKNLSEQEIECLLLRQRSPRHPPRLSLPLAAHQSPPVTLNGGPAGSRLSSGIQSGPFVRSTVFGPTSAISASLVVAENANRFAAAQKQQQPKSSPSSSSIIIANRQQK